jgi:hypothetical protein
VISLALYDAAVRQGYSHALEIWPQPDVVPLEGYLCPTPASVNWPLICQNRL